jgi:hypothetical protein
METKEKCYISCNSDRIYNQPKKTYNMKNMVHACMGDNPFRNVGGEDRAGLLLDQWSWQSSTHELIYRTGCITNVQV